MDGTPYTVLLQSVTGIDPLHTYSSRQRGAECTKASRVPRATVAGSVGNLFVTLQVFHLDEALTPPIQSSPSLGPRSGRRRPEYGAAGSEGSGEVWEGEGKEEEEVFDERLVMPLSVSDLPLDSEVRCSVYNTEQGLVGHCAFTPFALDGELVSGHCSLPIHHPASADAPAASGEGEQHHHHHQETANWALQAHALRRGVLPAVPWLDTITRRYAHTNIPPEAARQPRAEAGRQDSGETIPGALLHVHLPVPSRAVPVYLLTNPMDAVTGGHVPAATASPLRVPTSSSPSPSRVTLPYADHYRCLKDGSVCEAAATIVARSAFLLYDASAVPGVSERERLSQLAGRPPLQLEPLRLEDVALLWRYRHFITRDTRLFIPFMSSVDWRPLHHHPVPATTTTDTTPFDRPPQQQHYSAECRAACELMPRWRPLELSQVLGCLSSTFRGVGPVRQYAVRLLHRETDDLLCWTALQLIQALRYDSVGGGQGELAQFLLSRATGCWELCAALYWGASVEAAVGAHGATPRPRASSSWRIASFRAALEEVLARTQPAYLVRLHRQRELRACLCSLHATLNGVPGDRTTHILFGQRLLSQHACGFGELLTRPRTGNTATTAAATRASGREPKSTEAESSADADARPGQMLRGAVAATSLYDAPGTVTLPTHPAVVATGVVPESFYLFKSAKQPMQIGFTVSMPPTCPTTTTTLGERGSGQSHGRVFTPLAVATREKRARRGAVQASVAPTQAPPPPCHPAAEEVRLMFKKNDDVRQDQLIVQLLHWVDALFRLDGLDLCLTPYRVLATGGMEGLVEVVPDVVTFQSVQRDAIRYLRVHNPTSEGLRDAMDRYTRSFAGYSVFTFVLGVGDRHLENILLTRDGRLLHIDFGYILGHDPKPFPPPIKISREMLEVLGGPESPGYTEFKTYCCMAYNILRKHAALLLSLLQLMCHAEGLPQLTGVGTAPLGDNDDDSDDDDGSGDAHRSRAGMAGVDARADRRLSVLKVQEKLRLDLSSAQATQYLQNVIADSVGSIFTGLWDVLHAAAQATRA